MSFYWEKDHFYAEISCTRAPYGNQSMKLAKHMILYVASAQMSFYWEKDHFYAEISYTRAPYGNQSMKLAKHIIFYGKMAI
eukprot:snap_masked-scaffold_43-processed-gene-1.107-mRNA-1 protein AED:1.00 eAED:1.00 QI:0/0/0/0/1/1/2/0/80